MINAEKTICIIGFPALEELGLKSILHEDWTGRIETFSRLINPIVENENFIGYIITPEVFCANIDFFLPKKSKILLIYNEDKPISEENFFKGISLRSDESVIRQVIHDFIIMLDEPKSIQTDLSAREIEVLKLVASGKLNKEIADYLCISVNTVITHRKNITSKLGIRTVSALTLYAMMNGLL